MQIFIPVQFVIQRISATTPTVNSVHFDQVAGILAKYIFFQRSPISNNLRKSDILFMKNMLKISRYVGAHRKFSSKFLALGQNLKPVYFIQTNRLDLRNFASFIITKT
jgi:hypothetical protein